MEYKDIKPGMVARVRNSGNLAIVEAYGAEFRLAYFDNNGINGVGQIFDETNWRRYIGKIYFTTTINNKAVSETIKEQTQKEIEMEKLEKQIEELQKQLQKVKSAEG